MSARVDTDATMIAIALHACSTMQIGAYRAADTIGRLRRIARTLHGLYERACDYPVIVCATCERSLANGPHHLPNLCHCAKVESIQARADAIAHDLGVTIEHQTDPRGAPIVVWVGAAESGKRLGYLP